MATRQGGPDEDASSFGTTGPLSRSREGADLPSRTPEDYSLTDHVRQRLAQPGRYLSLPTVSEAVRRGQLRWNSTDGWRFSLVDDGVRYVVVVSDTDTDSPVVVTAWTEIESWEDAKASERWSDTAVHTIRLRSDLSDHHDEHVPGLIRPRVVERPFVVGDHHVTTAAGTGYVECAACGGRFRSKADLTRRRCRR